MFGIVLAAMQFAFEADPGAGWFSELRRTAAVNAGDDRLYLGGGAINWQFASLLSKAWRVWLVDRTYLDGFQLMHEGLLSLSHACGRTSWTSEKVKPAHGVQYAPGRCGGLGAEGVVSKGAWAQKVGPCWTGSSFSRV